MPSSTFPPYLTKEDVKPGLLFRDGRDVYTVSNVDAETFTARHDFPAQPRTTVRTFAFESVEFLRFQRATERDRQRVSATYV